MQKRNLIIGVTAGAAAIAGAIWLVGVQPTPASAPQDSSPAQQFRQPGSNNQNPHKGRVYLNWDDPGRQGYKFCDGANLVYRIGVEGVSVTENSVECQ